MSTHLAALAGGVLFAALAVFSVVRGQAPFGRGLFRTSVRRATHPAGFWLLVLMYAAGSVLCFWTLVRG